MKKENTYLYFTKFKREKVSQCNICKKMKPLSWDHIPPKGGIHLSSVGQETPIFIKYYSLTNNTSRNYFIKKEGFF